MEHIFYCGFRLKIHEKIWNFYTKHFSKNVKCNFQISFEITFRGRNIFAISIFGIIQDLTRTWQISNLICRVHGKDKDSVIRHFHSILWLQTLPTVCARASVCVCVCVCVFVQSDVFRLIDVWNAYVCFDANKLVWKWLDDEKFHQHLKNELPRVFFESYLLLS